MVTGKEWLLDPPESVGEEHAIGEAKLSLKEGQLNGVGGI